MPIEPDWQAAIRSDLVAERENSSCLTFTSRDNSPELCASPTSPAASRTDFSGEILLFADKSALAKEGRTRTSRDCFAVRCRDPSLRETLRPQWPMLGRSRESGMTVSILDFNFPRMNTEEQSSFRCRLVMPAAASP